MDSATPTSSPAQPREVTPQTRVGEIMTRNVLTAKPETAVVDIVRIMAKNKITGLPVVGFAGGQPLQRQTRRQQPTYSTEAIIRRAQSQ